MTTKIPVELSSTPGIVDGSNATAITIDSSENVGIGTASPLVKTHIHNGSDAKNIVLITGADTNTEYLGLGTESGIGYITSGSSSSDSHSLAFRYAASGVETEAMRIDTSGNLLVGTTDVNPSDNGASGDAGHAIAASGYLASARSGDTVALFNRMDSDGDVVDFRKNGSIVGSIGTISGQPYFTGATAGGFQISHLNSTNAVIVPVTAAGANTDATHDIGYTGKRFRNIVLSGQALVQGQATATPSFAFTNDTDTGMSRPTGNAVNFVTGGAERMRIDGSGNVLVGTTSVVQGTGAGFKLTSDDRLYMVNALTSGEQISYYGNGGYKFYVAVSGSIYSTNTSISSISDGRLKENVRDLDTGLEQVLALQPRRFDWKEGEGTGQKDTIGFIAQEVESVLPDVIDDFKHDIYDDAKSVKTTDIVPTLVKAIQEQQEQIEQLKTEIQTLKGE